MSYDPILIAVTGLASTCVWNVLINSKYIIHNNIIHNTYYD